MIARRAPGTALALALWLLQAAPACAQPAGPESLRGLLYGIRWVASAPTNYDPDVSPPTLPSEASIRADLQALQHAGCEGLVTYGATLPAIVDTAELMGFRAVLLGVWNPDSAEELTQAKESAHSPVVRGVIVGNEGLMFGRYSLTTLHGAMDEVRRDTGKPVSTTEVIESFYTTPELADWSDFVTVNAHPFFHGYRDPAQGVEWTVTAWDELLGRLPAKVVLFKEVGLPTAGGVGLSEEAQLDYYSRLRRTSVRFVFFEAFDTLFKRGEVEQSWGLFRADRSPKPAAAVLALSIGVSRLPRSRR